MTPLLASWYPGGGGHARRTRRLVWLGGTAALIVVVAVLAWVVFSQSPAAVPHVPPGVPQGITATGDPFLGSPTAPVTIDEYGDFQCPFCAGFARETEPMILATYIVPGKVRLVWHTLAFIGQESLWAGEAARCAQDQGKFWDFNFLLYYRQGAENSGAFSIARLVALGREAHLDSDALRACLESKRYLQAINDSNKAAGRRGVTSTPTFFINGHEATGALPFEEMARLIDAALAGH